MDLKKKKKEPSVIFEITFLFVSEVICVPCRGFKKILRKFQEYKEENKKHP